MRALVDMEPAWAASRRRGQFLRDAIAAIMLKFPHYGPHKVRFALQMKCKPSIRHIRRVMRSQKKADTMTSCPRKARILTPMEQRKVHERVPPRSITGMPAVPAKPDRLEGFKADSNRASREDPVWEPKYV